LARRGGLAQASFNSNDLNRHLIGPLVDRAAHCLAQYLPVTDVAQVELTAAVGDSEEMAKQMRKSLESASPLGTGAPKPPAKRDTKVLALASGHGVEVLPANGKAAEGEKPAREAWLLIPA